MAISGSAQEANVLTFSLSSGRIRIFNGINFSLFTVDDNNDINNMYVRSHKGDGNLFM